ncbi:MAG: hypothetical protein H0T73_16165 [Ardenticatenales bacterium]|nr:hypothetical protein [Ardenticatenales bacterium]
MALPIAFVPKVAYGGGPGFGDKAANGSPPAAPTAPPACGTCAPQSQPIVLQGHTDFIRTLAFSPDGQWLATGSDDRTARLWTLPIERLIEKTCAVAGRNFSKAEWEEYFPDEEYRATCEGLPVPEAE